MIPITYPILTDKGLATYEDFTAGFEGRKTWALNLNTGKAQWTRITDIVHCDHASRIMRNNRHLSVTSTRNQRIIVRKRGSKRLVVSTFGSVAGDEFLVRTAKPAPAFHALQPGNLVAYLGDETDLALYLSMFPERGDGKVCVEVGEIEEMFRVASHRLGVYTRVTRRSASHTTFKVYSRATYPVTMRSESLSKGPMWSVKTELGTYTGTDDDGNLMFFACDND